MPYITKSITDETMFEQHSTTENYVNPYKFNGKELDVETNLYYYGARYYDPSTSIWLSIDPLALWNPVQEVEHYIEGEHNGGIFNSMNLNVYGYCYQNPVRYLDPNGKQSDVTLTTGNPVMDFFANLFNNVFTSSESDVENFDKNIKREVVAKTIEVSQKVDNSQSKIKNDIKSTLRAITPDAAEANLSLGYTFKNTMSINVSVGLFTESHFNGNSGINYSISPGLGTSSGFSFSGNLNFYYAKSDYNNGGDYLLLDDLSGWQSDFDAGYSGLKLNGIDAKNYWGFGFGLDNNPAPHGSISKSFTPEFEVKQ